MENLSKEEIIQRFGEEKLLLINELTNEKEAHSFTLEQLEEAKKSAELASRMIADYKSQLEDNKQTTQENHDALQKTQQLLLAAQKKLSDCRREYSEQEEAMQKLKVQLQATNEHAATNGHTKMNGSSAMVLLAQERKHLDNTRKRLYEVQRQYAELKDERTQEIAVHEEEKKRFFTEQRVLKEENLKLHNELQAKMEELEEERFNVELSGKTIDELESKVNSLEERLEMALEDEDPCPTDNPTLQTESASKALIELRNKLTSAQEALDREKKENWDLMDEVNALKKQIVDVQPIVEENNLLKAEKERLLSNLAQKEEELQKATELKWQMESKVKMAEKHLEVIKKSAALESERHDQVEADLKSKIENLQLNNNNNSITKDLKSEELLKQRAEVEREVEKELADAKTELMMKGRQLEAVMKVLDRKENEIKELEEKLSASSAPQDTIAKEDEERQNEPEGEGLNDETSEKQIEAEALHASQVLTSLKEKLTEKQAQLELEAQERVNVETTLSALKVELAETKNECLDLRRQLQEKETESPVPKEAKEEGGEDVGQLDLAYADLKRQVDQLTERNFHLNNDVEQITAEKDAESKRNLANLQAIQQELDEKVSLIEHLQRENKGQDSQKELEDKEQLIEALQRQIVELQESQEQKKELIESLQSEIKELQVTTKVSELQDQVNELQESQEQKEELIESLQSEIKELQEINTVSELQGQIKELQESQEKKEEIIESLQSEIKELQETTMVSPEKELSTEQVLEPGSEHDSQSEAVLQEKQRLIEEKEELIEEKEELIGELQTEIQTLQENLQDLQEKEQVIQKLQNEIEEKSKELKEKKVMIEDLLSEQTTPKDQHTETALQKELEEKEALIESLQVEVKELENRGDTNTESEIEELLTELEEKNALVQDLKRKVEDLEKSQQELEESKNLVVKLQKEIEEQREQQEQFEEQEALIAELRKELEELEGVDEEIEEKENSIEELRIEVNTLKEKQESLKEKEQLIHDLQSRVSELEGKEEQLNELQKQLDEIEEEKSVEIEDLKAQISSFEQQQKQQNKNQLEFTNLLNEKDAQIANLKQQITETQSTQKKSPTEAKGSSLKEEVLQKRRMVGRLKKALDQHKQKIKEKEEEIKTIKVRLSGRESELKKKKDQLSKLVRERQKLEQLKKELEKQKQQKESAESQRNSLKKTCDKLRISLERAKKSERSREEKIKQACKEKLEEAKKLETENTKIVVTELNSELTSARKTLKKLSKELDLQKQRNVELEEKIEGYSVTLEDWKVEVSELEEACATKDNLIEEMKQQYEEKLVQVEGDAGAASAEKNALQEKVLRLTTKCKNLELSVEKNQVLEQTLETMKSRCEEVIKKEREMRAVLIQENTKLNTSVETLTLELEATKSRATLEDQLNELHESLELLEKQREEHETEKQDLIQKQEHLKKELQTEKGSHKYTLGELNTLRQESENLSKKIQDLTSSVTEQKASLSKLQEEKSTLTTKLQSLQEDHSSKAGELSACKKDLDKKTKLLDTCQSQILSLKENLASSAHLENLSTELKEEKEAHKTTKTMMEKAQIEHHLATTRQLEKQVSERQYMVYVQQILEILLDDDYVRTYLRGHAPELQSHIRPVNTQHDDPAFTELRAKYDLTCSQLQHTSSLLNQLQQQQQNPSDLPFSCIALRELEELGEEGTELDKALHEYRVQTLKFINSEEDLKPQLEHKRFQLNSLLEDKKAKAKLTAVHENTILLKRIVRRWENDFFSDYKIGPNPNPNN